MSSSNLKKNLASLNKHAATEKALSITNAYNRSLIEASLDPLVTISVDGKITDVNEATIKVTGISREGLIGTDFANYFTEPEKAREGYRLVFSKGMVTDYPLTIRRMDGKLTDVLYNASVYRGESGKVIGVFAAARDITQRKIAEQTLRESEARLREAQQIAHVGHWELDLLKNTLYWSDEVYRIFGLEPQEFGATYEAFLEHVHPDDREVVNKAYTDSVRNRSGYCIEHRVLKKNGEVRHVNERCSTEYDDNGKPLRSIGTVLDITERKEAEDWLYRTNRTLKMLKECNQALIHSTNEPDLLNKICNIIVDIGGYRLAWVGYAGKDANKTVSPVAQSGYEEGYLETLNITWADTDRGHGPTGTAIRTGKYVVVKNILTDPVYEPWRSEAVKRRYASSIAVPLVADNLTIGSLNIYAVEPDAFDTDEINLLTELANDLSFGIMTMRMQGEKKKAEIALKAEKQMFLDVLETLPAYVVLLTPDYHVPFANRFFRERFGESHGRRCFEYLFGRNEPCEVCETYKVLKTMKTNAWEWTGPDKHNYYVHDFPFIATDGSTIVLEMGIDITERKKAEEELQQKIEELERFRKATAQREFRIKELKDRLKEMESEVERLKALQTGGCS